MSYPFIIKISYSLKTFQLLRFLVTLLLSLVTADRLLMLTMTKVSFIMLPYNINSVNFLSFLAPLEVQYSCIHGLSFHTYLSS